MKRLKFVLFLFLLVFSFFIVYSGSIDLNKTIVGDGNISLGDEIQFSLYVENNDVYNITNETFIFSDIYDFNYLNYTWSSENLSNFGFGNISWELNIPSFTNRTIYVNFTALQNGSNLENYFELRNNSILIDDDSVYFNISNLNGNITPAILNVSIVKTLLNEGNISVNDTLEFEINISNVGEVNITSFDYTFIDIFNYNYLNYTSSSLVINNSGLGNLSWKFDLNTNSSLSLYVNFTALQNGSNLINYFELRNISGNTLGFDNVLFNISNSSGNSSFPILNVSIVKTLLNEGNISVNDTLEFMINISNVGEVNITNSSFYLIDIFNYNYLNYTSSSLVINSSNLGNVSWRFNLLSGLNLSILVNFTALQSGSNLNNSVFFKNSSHDIIAHSSNQFSILNVSSNVSNPILNVSITRVLLNMVNISINDTLRFMINISNVGEVNITNSSYFLQDIFSAYLNYSSSSLKPYNISSNYIRLNLSLNVGENMTIYINYTALYNGNNLSNNLSFNYINSTTIFSQSLIYNILPLGNYSDFILNASINKILLNSGNISVDDIVEFRINVSNLGLGNITSDSYYFEDEYNVKDLVYLSSSNGGVLNGSKIKWLLNVSSMDSEILSVNFSARYPTINQSNYFYLKNSTGDIQLQTNRTYSIYGNSYNQSNGVKIETLGVVYPGVNLQNNQFQMIYRISNFNNFSFSFNDYYFRSDFTYSIYNYSLSSMLINESSVNYVKWRFNLSANSSIDLKVNYTLKNIGNDISNVFYLKNNSGEVVSILDTRFRIYNETVVIVSDPPPTSGGGGGGGGGGSSKDKDEVEEVIIVNVTKDIVNVNKSSSLNLALNKTNDELIDKIKNILDEGNKSLVKNESIIDEIIDIFIDDVEKEKVSGILNINRDEIKEVKVIDKQVELIKISKIDSGNINEVLSDFNRNIRNSVSKVTATGNSIGTKIILNITVYDIVDSKGRKAQLTNIKKRVQIDVSNVSGNLIHIVEIIPKEVAYSAYLIIGDFKILEEDPVLLFTFPIEEANDGFVDIEYSVSGNVIKEVEGISTAAVVSNEVIVPELKKNFTKMIFIIIFILLVISSIIGYWYYENYYRKKKKKIDFSEFEFK